MYIEIDIGVEIYLLSELFMLSQLQTRLTHPLQSQHENTNGTKKNSKNSFDRSTPCDFPSTDGVGDKKVRMGTASKLLEKEDEHRQQNQQTGHNSGKGDDLGGALVVAEL